MLSKDNYLLAIISHLCIYCDYDIDMVSTFLNKSVFYHYHVFIANVCNIGSNLKDVLNESK